MSRKETIAVGATLREIAIAGARRDFGIPQEQIPASLEDLKELIFLGVSESATRDSLREQRA